MTRTRKPLVAALVVVTLVVIEMELGAVTMRGS